MPYPLASATAQNFRQDVSRLIGDWWPSVTTAAGTVTTVVDSTLSGWGDNEFQEWYALMTGGAAINQWRIVDSFTASTLTLRTALGLASGNGSSYELHRFRPDWFKLACNLALTRLWPAIYHPLRSYLPTTANLLVYGMPRNMVVVWRLQQAGRTILQDAFDSLSSNWVTRTGTWGVLSSRLRSTSDAQGDLLTQDFNIKDILISCILTGTLASAVDYRTPALTMRGNDATNYLWVRLLNNQVILGKTDGGVSTNLSTGAVTTSDGVDYSVQVEALGPVVRVWVDEVQLIEYRLIGTDLKYVDYTQAGFLLVKAGAPATAARWDSYSISQVFEPFSWPQWEVDALSASLHLQRAPGTSRLLRVEGGTPLTQLAADTVVGTLASDTVAALEIQTTDRAWELLLLQGAAELYAIAASPANAHSPEERLVYLQESARFQSLAKGRRDMLYQPRNIGPINHPGSPL